MPLNLEKLERLVEQHDQRFASLADLTDRRERARLAFRRQEFHVGRIDQDEKRGYRIRADASSQRLFEAHQKSIASERRKLETLKNEWERLSLEHDRLGLDARALGQLLNHLRRYAEQPDTRERRVAGAPTL